MNERGRPSWAAGLAGHRGASGLDRGTHLSWSRPRSSCRYTIWISASGSSGSLQSPRVTAECVRLQPAAEGNTAPSGPPPIAPSRSPHGRWCPGLDPSASKITLPTHYFHQAPLPPLPPRRAVPHLPLASSRSPGSSHTDPFNPSALPVPPPGLCSCSLLLK